MAQVPEGVQPHSVGNPPGLSLCASGGWGLWEQQVGAAWGVALQWAALRPGGRGVGRAQDLLVMCGMDTLGAHTVFSTS